MQRSPATLSRQAVRTACFFCAALISVLTVLPSSAHAQQKGNRLRPRYLSNEAPDQARGVEVMREFRQLGMPGDYFLEFELQVLPRRGEASTVSGRMWGSRNLTGPVFRADLRSSRDAVSPMDSLLGQNGPSPEAWRYQPEIGGGGILQTLSADTILDSVGGTGLSMFELQMPFIYWNDFVYEGVTRVRGRSVHAFLMYPPDDFAAAHPEVAGVRLHLDAQFNALMQAVVLDANEQPERKLTVLDLKKLGDQWIVKSIDVRDEKTRDKVRFEVIGAALNLHFASGLFAPEALRQPLVPPSGVERL